MNKKGLLIVISGPSGCGKGTLIKGLMQGDKNIKYSVSATTRKPRPGEVDGESYFFVTKQAFEKEIASGGMLEYAEYCDNYYGTPKSYVDKCLEKGNDIILEIEVVGACKLMQQGVKAVYIFVVPPSLSELRARLEGRKTETQDVVEKRLAQAIREIPLAEKYDYIVINDIVDDGIERLKSIIISEKCKTENMNNIIEEVLKNA